MRFSLPVAPEVRDRLEQLEIPFNSYGVDPYGISKAYLGPSFTALRFFFKHYFSVESHGIENVPPRGRVMLVGNHSGGVALDGAMVVASQFLEMNPPSRLVFVHLGPMHRYWMTMIFAPEGAGTRLTWHMQFESPGEAAGIASFVAQANQQNFDRLAAVLSEIDPPIR